MKAVWFAQVFILFTVTGCHGGIFIPEEVQTIFQLFYSYLPQIRTGTDSKVGVGFRLGRNADFQVVLELGPQTSNNDGGGNNRRREAQIKDQRLKKSVPTQPFATTETIQINDKENEISNENDTKYLEEPHTKNNTVEEKVEVLATENTFNATQKSLSETSQQSVLERVMESIVSLFS